MKKLTKFQKFMLADAINSYLTKLHDDTLEYNKQHPDKHLLNIYDQKSIGAKFYLQQRDKILHKLKLD